MKKFIVIFLAVLISASCALPAFAYDLSGDDMYLLYDEAGLFYDDEAGSLNMKLNKIMDDYRVGVYIISYDTQYFDAEECADSYASALGIGDSSATLYLILDSYGQCTAIVSDGLESIMSQQNADRIVSDADAFAESGVYDYTDAILNNTASFLADNMSDTFELPRVIDNADLLDTAQEESLSQMISQVISIYSFDIIILTENNIGDKTPEEYADDYYDYNGYGYGDGYDGMLFLITMQERKWQITTYGYGKTAFTDYGIESIGEDIVPYLSEQEYYDAFNKLIDISVTYLKAAKAGKPVDESQDIADDNSGIIGSGIIIAWLVCIIVSLMITLSMKKRMKTAAKSTEASEYVKAGSFVVTAEDEQFLYSNVVKTRRIEESSSGGGSSSHSSSSGRSHGGGGGSF